MDLTYNKVQIGSHRFPVLWMAVTVVVVIASLGGAGYYFDKAYNTKHNKSSSTAATKTTPVATTTITTTAPTAAKAQAAQVSSDLKQIDIAQLKSSINDVKSALSGFSQ